MNGFNQLPIHLNAPRIGQRIFKTSVAVLICMLISYLRGHSGEDMSAESMITAIICMQPYVSDTKSYALSRLAGTLAGAVLGLAFLLILTLFPSLGKSMPLLYLLMSCGVLIALYSAVLLRKPDAASLTAIVFLCIVISFPDIESPLYQTLLRILETFIGTTVAIAVNIFRLPRRKNPDQVFFVRASDLVPHRYASIPASALFQLNYLYADGARICLMTEHAPAFFAMQMATLKQNTPMIVMGGAAIYSVAENRYLHAEFLPEEDYALLQEALGEAGCSYSIYTIHRNATCIFHRGKVTVHEMNVYERMRRSPYRSYLEGENFRKNEIVYLKVIDEWEKIEALERSLKEKLPEERFRMVIRPQTSFDGIDGLYIYAASATLENAKAQLMRMLDPSGLMLTPRDFRLPEGFRSERDAIRLLRRVGNAYEPLLFLPQKKPPKQAKAS